MDTHPPLASPRRIALIGAPFEEGAGREGCRMGPEMLRVAGLRPALAALGHEVADGGDITPGSAGFAAFAERLAEAGRSALAGGATPVFLGGDHALSIGSVAGVARHAQAAGRKLFVLWLDAHADFNTPLTSPTGNLHGMSTALLCGEPGFPPALAPFAGVLAAERLHLFGLRSVDPEERRALARRGVAISDMRRIDEFGVAALVREVVEAVRSAGGLLHVSLDVDFLDPDLAPGVGTVVAGGATYREAHLAMEMLHESGLVASLDIVELNPALDMAGRSARLMVDLAASLFGREVVERPGRAASTR